jgi:hypothetical protein
MRTSIAAILVVMGVSGVASARPMNVKRFRVTLKRTAGAKVGMKRYDGQVHADEYKTVSRQVTSPTYEAQYRLHYQSGSQGDWQAPISTRDSLNGAKSDTSRFQSGYTGYDSKINLSGVERIETRIVEGTETKWVDQ